MSTVGLFDRLVLKRQARGFILRCEDPALPADHRNLVHRAACAFAEEAGLQVEQLNCSITLVKSIPSGAGLGGGSSDAATTITALDRLHHTDWSADRLMKVGSTVGSDVPFFFAGPSALVRGRGEQVLARPAAKAKWIVLVLPPIHVSTADCYRQFDAMGLGDDEACQGEPDVAEWAQLSAGDLGSRLVNDLEPPAFALQPSLAELLSRVQAATKQIVRMSGSGSSLFSLTDEASQAIELAGIVQRDCGVRALAVELAPSPRKIDPVTA